jgi:hypothetical protein
MLPYSPRNLDVNQKYGASRIQQTHKRGAMGVDRPRHGTGHEGPSQYHEFDGHGSRPTPVIHQSHDGCSSTPYDRQ